MRVRLSSTGVRCCFFLLVAASLVPGLAVAQTGVRDARPTDGGRSGESEVLAPDPTRGIATLMRDGRRVGFGVVLEGDGRILTSLSALSHGNQLAGQFADGSSSALRVVATDRGSDLALLEPLTIYWSDGVRPSTLEPEGDGAALSRYRARGRRLEAGAVPVESRATLLGRDGAVIDGALLVSGRFREDELGTPLFDAAGQVVAVVARACAPRPATSCRLEPYAAPVSALKAFLKTVPKRDPLPASWLGFRGVAGHAGPVAGVRLVDVRSGSPAALAGLKPVGSAEPDLVVAVDGVPVATDDELEDRVNHLAVRALSRRSPNAPEPLRLRLLVFGGDRFREVELSVSPPESRAATSSEADSPPTSTSAPGSQPKRLAPTPYRKDGEGPGAGSTPAPGAQAPEPPPRPSGSGVEGAATESKPR